MNTRETALHCALLWLGLAGSVLAWDAEGRARRADAADPGSVTSGAIATTLRAGAGTRGVDATRPGVANTPAPAGRGAVRLCVPAPPRPVRCGDALVRPRSQR